MEPGEPKEKPTKATLWFDFLEPVGMPLIIYLSVVPTILYFAVDFANAVGSVSTSLVLLKGFGAFLIGASLLMAAFYLVLNCLWFEPPDDTHFFTEQQANWITIPLWLISAVLGVLIFTGVEELGGFISDVIIVISDCSHFPSKAPQYCESARRSVVTNVPNILQHIYLGAVLLVVALYASLILVALTRLVVRHTDQRFWVRAGVSAVCSVVLPIGVTLVLFHLFGVEEPSSLAIAVVSVGATQYGASLFSFG